MYKRQEQKSCDIFQLDLAGVGGILEAKKIASMCEAWHTQVTTHFWAGPVNFAAQIQLDACCPNFLIQEMCIRDRNRAVRRTRP